MGGPATCANCGWPLSAPGSLWETVLCRVPRWRKRSSLASIFQGTLRNGSRLRGRYAVSRGDVLAALSRNGWDAERAAAELGFGRTTFFKRLRQLGVSIRSVRKVTRTPWITELGTTSG